MSDDVKAQYQVLGELRRIDEKITRLQTEAERIPEEIGKLNQALSGRRAEYDRIKALFDANEKKIRKSESDLKEKEDKLHKAEGKMMEVKTNEEYQAAIKENESQKTDKRGMEEQILVMMNELDAQRTQLKEAEKNFSTYESVVKQDTARLQEEQNKILQQLEEQLAKRASSSAQLSSDVKATYLRIATRQRGVAVVAVENGMCQGCHMKMRPQLYNEILGYKTIHRCPSCGRILILAPKESEASAELA